jgi:hypothetical protein
MVDAPLLVIFKMVHLVFSNTVQTTIDIFNLFVELINSVAYIISVAGPLGLLIAIIILVPSIWIISKFFTGNLKTILTVGLILFFILVVAASFA